MIYCVKGYFKSINIPMAISFLSIVDTKSSINPSNAKAVERFVLNPY